MPDPVRSSVPSVAARPTRDAVRRSIADELLAALDALVVRHRALARADEQNAHMSRHAELIAAEVAHQLAVTRTALHRHPAVRRAD